MVVSGLSVGYGDHLVLSGVDLTVDEGEVVALMGASGCGKTTLIRALAGLLPLASGTVATAPERSGRPGVMFQTPLLFPWLNALANVQFPCKVIGIDGDARPLLAAVGLDGNEAKYPWELSGGMQRRVALARALVVDPAFLMLDEPFSGVDEMTSEKLYELLAMVLARTATPCLLTTHSLYEAVFLSDRIVVLSGAPAGVSAIHEVGLPRPRDGSIRNDRRFAEQVCLLRRVIRRSGDGE